MLLHAASGLEKTLVSSNRDTVLRDTTVAQISALLYYKAQVLGNLENNKEFQNKFKTTVFKQIQKDFGAYIDAQARSKPKSFHHVYEWKKIGTPLARLFKLNFINSEGLSFKVDYELLDSRYYVPNPKGKKKYKFVKKASIMEAGVPVKIAPKASKRLVFEIDGATIFMPIGASVTVQNPGGRMVKQQFRSTYSRFFNSQLVGESFKKSGFEKIFKKAIEEALRAPTTIKSFKYAFSANAIGLEAKESLSKSFGGVL